MGTDEDDRAGRDHDRAGDPAPRRGGQAGRHQEKKYQQISHQTHLIVLYVGAALCVASCRRERSAPPATAAGTTADTKTVVRRARRGAVVEIDLLDHLEPGIPGRGQELLAGMECARLGDGLGVNIAAQCDITMSASSKAKAPRSSR
jgi:hypothetical protein